MRKRDLYLLAAILLVGTALRLCRIDWQSAWGDEDFSLYAAGQDFGDRTSER